MSTCTDKMHVLILGCGRKQTLDHYGIYRNGTFLTAEDVDLWTLDANPVVQPRLVCRLGQDPIPLPDNSIDLAIAMHLLEHIGTAGEAASWFQFWVELYRVLKPDAVLQFECPYYSSVWAWADPTHVRAISEYTFLYLNQDAYKAEGSAIPDFRPRCDFVLESWLTKADGNPDVVAREGNRTHIEGRLVARKPLRPYLETS